MNEVVPPPNGFFGIEFANQGITQEHMHTHTQRTDTHRHAHYKDIEQNKLSFTLHPPTLNQKNENHAKILIVVTGNI